MRFAFFSDVHANLPALEAVFASIDAYAPDATYCLGDLVGYAPWPNEVVAAVRARQIPTLAGNYDEGVGVHSADCGCAYKTPEDEARGVESISYTNQVVTAETRAYLAGLPRQMRFEMLAPRAPGARPFTVLMVHGSPIKINQYLFEDHPDKSLLRLMREADADVMLMGHTHKPWYRAMRDEESGTWRHAINIGSVGKPKDGDPRACWVLLDVPSDASAADEHAIEPTFVRVEYDVERAAQAVEASPLPNQFADMLRKAY